jgi:hypothetical protein
MALGFMLANIKDQKYHLFLTGKIEGDILIGNAKNNVSPFSEEGMTEREF